jgi:hypothetical protein
MEYGRIIKQSLGIAWRKKYLWVFGFFASLGAGGGGNYSSLYDRNESFRAWAGLKEWILSHLGLIFVLTIAAAGLMIVLMALYLISKGGLIKSVSQISRNQPDSFEQTLGYGLRYLWRILGIDMLYGLAVVLTLGLTVLPALLMIFAGGGGVRVLGVLLVLLMALPLVALLFGLGLLANFSYQMAVVEDQRVFRAVTGAASLFRRNIGRTALLGIIAVGIALLYAAALIAGLIFLAVPFVILGAFNLWAGLIPGILIGLPLLLASSGFYGTFISGYWTLAYMDLAGTETGAEQPAHSPALADEG